MSYNLYLDDMRYPYDTFNYTKDPRYSKLDWIVVRSHAEFVKTVNKLGLPNLVSFDHDLADSHYDMIGQSNLLSWDEYYVSDDREMTGYDSAKWLCDYCLDHDVNFPEYLVHSWNKVGSVNIKSYIENFKKHTNK